MIKYVTVMIFCSHHAVNFISVYCTHTKKCADSVGHRQHDTTRPSGGQAMYPEYITADDLYYSTQDLYSDVDTLDDISSQIQAAYIERVSIWVDSRDDRESR